MADSNSSLPDATPAAIEATLAERGKRYGKFKDHAAITQRLKKVMLQHPGYVNLTNSQAEALEMIAHKIGRILNGDPNYHDSWHDIVGYAQLVADELIGKEV
jgi:hypothetical protein